MDIGIWVLAPAGAVILLLFSLFNMIAPKTIRNMSFKAKGIWLLTGIVLMVLGIIIMYFSPTDSSINAEHSVISKPKTNSASKVTSTPRANSNSNYNPYADDSTEEIDWDDPKSWLGHDELYGYEDMLDEYAEEYIANLGPGDDIEDEIVAEWFIDHYEEYISDEQHW